GAAASRRRRCRGSHLRAIGRTSIPGPAPASTPAARRSAPISRGDASRAQMPASASSTTAAPTAVLISGALSCFLTAPSSSLTAPSPRGAVICGGTLLPQGIEVTGGARGADLVDQAHHEARVVDGAQGRGQHLLGPVQVKGIGRGTGRARVAAA